MGRVEGFVLKPHASEVTTDHADHTDEERETLTDET